MGRLSSVPDRIDAAIRFFLYVLIFWLPYSPAVIESSVIICVFLWVIKRTWLFVHLASISSSPSQQKLKNLFGAYAPPGGYLNKYIAIFIVACLISIVGSSFLTVALQGFVRKTLEWFVIFYLVQEVFKERKHFRIALIVFLVTSLSTCVDALVQFYFTRVDFFCQRQIAVSRGGASGPFKHANSLGGYLTVCVPFIFSFLTIPNLRKKFKLFYAAAFILYAWVLLISLSRASWLAVMLGLALYLLLLGKKKFVLVLAGIVCCVAILAVFLPQEFFRPLRISIPLLLSSFWWRFDLWLDSLSMIVSRPFFGHGLNIYMELFQEYHQRFKYLMPTFAHNCYIQMAVETGLVGLAGFLSIFITFFRKEIGHWFQKRQELDVPIFLGMLCGIFAFLVHSFFDTNFYSLQLSAFFWLFFGMAISFDKMLR